MSFVRYIDKKDNFTYDLHYIGGNPSRDDSFEKILADDSKRVVYRWNDINESIKDEIRLRRFGEQVLNINNSKVSAYYMFSYSTPNAHNSIFGEPENVYCFNYPAGSEGEVSGWVKALNTVFKN